MITNIIINFPVPPAVTLLHSYRLYTPSGLINGRCPYLYINSLRPIHTYNSFAASREMCAKYILFRRDAREHFFLSSSICSKWM